MKRLIPLLLLLAAFGFSWAVDRMQADAAATN